MTAFLSRHRLGILFSIFFACLCLDLYFGLTCGFGEVLMGICLAPFNVLRMKTEDLGPELYTRASWRSAIMNLIPRSEWPIGAGLDRSAFTIGRSEPSTDEETWAAIAVSSGPTYTGSCGVTYNQTFVGHLEVHYKPEQFGLLGPLICQDDLTLHWQSVDFWEKYFQALEKRNQKSIINRLDNIYMNYVPKWAAVSSGFAPIDGIAGLVQPPPSFVDLNGDTAGSTKVPLPGCVLGQDMLDLVALHLMEIGATDPDSNGWITLGPEGPIFPLDIGVEMSNRILLNNSELRRDYRSAFEAFGDANPVIARLGASRVIKNFRHVLNLTPPRWAWVPNGNTITLVPATGTTAAVTYHNTSGQDRLQRIPTWIMREDSANVTKGKAAYINPQWQDPAVASIEGAKVLNPWVFTEEVLRPVNSAPGMKWQPQNYFGEWMFVTGNDALIGFPDCPAGAQDPTHKQGRHVAEYRHAAKPVFPDYGALILYQRCTSNVDCASCS